ncbi:hypothetical protein chiPu_0000359 [Chiloscyllium punctatum]|uniref:Uncharacterized protein n=1 Tax=Chiloscyllium punctatum TaxID=137246 RepID=A0A401RV31_CHIPU|nr:hypothetical protein [Chiloscyllium punctatum]
MKRGGAECFEMTPVPVRVRGLPSVEVDFISPSLLLDQLFWARRLVPFVSSEEWRCRTDGFDRGGEREHTFHFALGKR